MSVNVWLNDIQCITLYKHCFAKAKGGPHGRRMERLHKAFDYERIEELSEKNAEVQADYEAKGLRTVPKDAWVHRFQATDPARLVTLEDGDFDKLWTWTREWEKEEELDEAKRKQMELPDWKVMNPLLKALQTAYDESEKRKEGSKSNGAEAPKAEPAATNA